MDLSINVEQSEYYTLQEACNYLNIKHNINNFTQKKLLRKIIKYKTPNYVFARGFELTGDFETNILLQKRDDEQQALYIDVINKVADMLSAVCLDGILLQLHENILINLPFQEAINTENGVAESELFVGALPLFTLESNSRTLDYLKVYFDKFYVTKVLALYPRFALAIDEEVDEDQLQTVSEIRPRVSNWYSFNGPDNSVELYFNIKAEDLIVLHRDLINLESNIIEDTPPPTNETKNILKDSGLKQRQGVSSAKILAKELAKHIATEHWKRDNKNQIRISEMCEVVWSKLIESHFEEELPNQPQSLKPWIADRAPSYAREAGRPTGK